MAPLKGSFPSGSPVQCSALSIHKCCLSSVGSLEKVPTPPPKDWLGKGPLTCLSKATNSLSAFSPWKWRELTSVEAFQKDPPFSLPFPPHLIPTRILKDQTIPACFSWISDWIGKEILSLDNSSERLENALAVPLLNSFVFPSSFLTMTLLKDLGM